MIKYIPKSLQFWFAAVMPARFNFIVTALLLAGAAYSASASAKAGRDIKRSSRTQAAIAQEQTDEQNRRLEQDLNYTVGQQRVNAAASGVDARTSKSILEQRAEAFDEANRQARFNSRVGAANAAAIRARGDAAELQGYANAFSTLTSPTTLGAISTAKDSVSNWWKVKKGK